MEVKVASKEYPSLTKACEELGYNIRNIYYVSQYVKVSSADALKIYAAGDAEIVGDEKLMKLEDHQERVQIKQFKKRYNYYVDQMFKLGYQFHAIDARGYLCMKNGKISTKCNLWHFWRMPEGDWQAMCNNTIKRKQKDLLKKEMEKGEK